MVDLDGARSGSPENLEHVRRIAEAGAVPVQVGGGLRTADAVADVLAAGATRVVLGTAALEDPALVEALALEHPNRIVVGADARSGKIAVEGWERESQIGVEALIADLAGRGVSRFVYTPVEVDGTLEGPGLDGPGRQLPRPRWSRGRAGLLGRHRLGRSPAGARRPRGPRAVGRDRRPSPVRGPLHGGRGRRGAALASTNRVLVQGPRRRPGRAARPPASPAPGDRRAQAARRPRREVEGPSAQEPLGERARGDAPPGQEARPRRSSAAGAFRHVRGGAGIRPAGKKSQPPP